MSRGKRDDTDDIADEITKHLINQGTTNEKEVRAFLSKVSTKVLTRVASFTGQGLNCELPE